MPIDFQGWVAEFRDAWTDSPKRALLEALYYSYLGAWLTVTTRPSFEIGTNIYEREWDALIVLDACRVDALKRVAPEYEFLDADRIGSTWSVGSASIEWLCKTFTTDYREEIAETAYVAANPYLTHTFRNGMYAPPKSAPFGAPRRNVLDAEDFAYLRNVYETRHDERFNTVLPEALTDAAIAAGRTVDAERYVFHYMQPHTPYFAAALAEDRSITDVEYKPWSALRRGDLEYGTAKRWYLDTLRHTLDSVGVLLANLEAERVVITADHGEAFGEWFAHNHPTGFPHPAVKTVPWTTVSATDTGSHDPEPLAKRETSENRLEEQLEALGYA